MDSLSHNKKRSLKIGFVIIGLLALMLVILWVRVFYGTMKAYQKGENYLKENQVIRAITYFDRSIHWYTPFNPYVNKSAEELWEIGIKAEEQGDIKLALISFRTIRRGFYAASHFITPGGDWIKRCELKIDILTLAEEKNRTGSGERTALKEKLRKDQKGKSPIIPWTIILEIGFLGWIGTVIGFIMYRLRGERKPKILTSSVFIWVIPFVIFFALWIVGMVKA